MLTLLISFLIFVLFLGLIVFVVQEIVKYFALPAIIIRVVQLIAGFIALLYLAQLLGINVGLPLR